jgi:dTDP-4-dehydrorhamnose 3,5-epimerase
MTYGLIATCIEGAFIIKHQSHEDQRGIFIKPYSKAYFESQGLGFVLHECYYSISKKNVLRGMHFQKPPFDHEKIVFCNAGHVLDVICDVRPESLTYGNVYSIELSRESEAAIFLPKGVAHGFLSLEDNSMLTYLVSSAHHEDADTGILWNSINFSWPIENPIISIRDSEFPTLENL